MISNAPVFVLSACLVACVARAADGTSDVQRLQAERERHQLELRLKMQQQQERALRAPGEALVEQRRGALEREQVQRQHQLSSEEARRLSAPASAEDAASAVRRQLDHDRADQAASEQMQRFEIERRRW